MLDTSKRTIATLAAAACLGAGGWAMAASTNGTSTSTAATAAQATATQTATPGYGQTPAAPQGQQGQPPSGPMPQRSDEKLLTGDDATKAKAAALAKVPGATIVRVETDADGGGVYEAHITKSDGSPATVLMDKSFTVTSVLDR